MTTEEHEPPAGYTDAVEELEAILREIEGDAVDVDMLADKVARASVLIEFCRDRIRTAEDALNTDDDGETDDDTSTPE